MASWKKKNATREERFIRRAYEMRLKNPARHTPGKATSKAEQNPDHLSGQARIRGNLASGSHSYVFAEGKLKQAYVQSYYSWNAWNYIGSGADAVRDIYKSVPHPEYHFFHTDHRPNFYQLYPIAALGRYADAEARYKQEKDPDLRRYYRRRKEALYPKVMSQMGRLKSTLDKVASKELEHKDAAAKVEEELHELETKMFKYTRSLGSRPRQKLN